MPKEYVDDTTFIGATDEDGNEVDIKAFRVRVGWNRETGDVQIATVDESADPFSVESGLFVNLDRRGINHLIQLLRKARDQAFGRDE